MRRAGLDENRGCLRVSRDDLFSTRADHYAIPDDLPRSHDDRHEVPGVKLLHVDPRDTLGYQIAVRGGRA